MPKQESKPNALPVHHINIPAELRTLKQWVTWDHTFQVASNEYRKVPKYPPNNKWASSTDASSWTTYSYTLTRLHAHDGIGFVFTDQDPYCGIDIDGCRNPQTGAMEPWAQSTIEQFNSYAEVSPSGTGVKIWIRAKASKSGKSVPFEVYDKERYFTLTGHHLPGSPATIEPRQAELDQFLAKHFANKGISTKEGKREICPELAAVPLSDRQQAAREHLQAKPPSVSGKPGGGAEAYCMAVAAELIQDFGFTADEALPVLMEWGQRGIDVYGGSDPWNEEQLRRKLEYAEDHVSIDDEPRFSALEEQAAKMCEYKEKNMTTVSKPMTAQDAYNAIFMDAKTFREEAAKEQQTYLVDRILPEGGLNMISGLSFAGKSTFLRWLVGNSFLCGNKCLQFDAKKTHVLYLNADNNPLKLMDEQIAAGWNEFEKSDRWHYHRYPETELSAESLRLWVYTIWAKIGRKEPVLVITDTMRPMLFADCKAGEDKDAIVMTNKLKPYKTLTASKDMEGLLTIWWIYHNARTTNEYYGSGAFMNLLDSYWNFTRDKESKVAKIEVTTRRDYTILEVAREGGQFITKDYLNNLHSHELAYKRLLDGEEISRNVLLENGVSKDVANSILDTFRDYGIVEPGRNQRLKATATFKAGWQKLLTDRNW